MRVNMLVNTLKPEAVAGAAAAVKFLKARSVEVGSTPDCSSLIDALPVSRDKLAAADLVTTFGGDGTVLHAAQLCSELGTPILGVHFGRFGFVTLCAPNQVPEYLGSFLEGKGFFDERMMLRTDLIRSGSVVTTLHCLNETVMQRSSSGTMLNVRVSVNGLELTSYPADGVMVSTPTGSTGYNLSSGGPILHPGLNAMILTAVSPHTLSARPLLLETSSTVSLELQTSGDAAISVDGMSKIHLFQDDRVDVTKSSRVTKLFAMDHSDFLRKLSDRLFWSKGMNYGN